ncbi:MAG: Bax inhibitor-1/YccA family protein [Elusimicrobiaceae bacterium]|nr:Bax inhibitor-1/YccA family protein [Elusimicrobiaceae bacterium]
MAQNPVLNEQVFRRSEAHSFQTTRPMTLQGTINKTFLLLFICVLGGMIAWTNPGTWSLYSWWTLLGAFVIALITSFKPTLSPVLSPIYAFAEGLFLGTLSAAYNTQFHGIVFNAIAATILVFFVMLILYTTGVIQVTRRLLITIFSATVAICLLYVGSWILSLFGVSTAHLTSSSPLSIGISVIVCLVAAFNFLLDFHFIDQMTQRYTTPKYMEWYSAFGLLVTLIWLYVEILNLLGKTQNR